MSIETWKAEFYPVDADESSKELAIEHSLRKWRGLTPENLQKHGLTIDRKYLRDAVTNEIVFVVGDQTCALCHHYVDDNFSCKACPLSIVRGSMPCDVAQDEELHSPYVEFMQFGNPEPMIKLLEEARDLDLDIV